MGIRGLSRTALRRSVVLLSATGMAVGLAAGVATEGASGAGTTINIEAQVPLSGALGVLGQSEQRGVTIAEDEINNSHYLGSAKLAVTFKDDQGDPATAVSQYKSFAGDSSISAVLCCTISTEGGALRPLAISTKTPTVLMTAAAPGLPALPNFVRITYDATKPTGPWAQAIDVAAKHWNLKTAAFVVSNDSPISAAPQVIKTYGDAFKRNHITMKRYNTLTTDSDFSGVASSIVSQNPSVVVMDVQSDRAPLLAAALLKGGYKGHLIGTPNFTTQALANQAGAAFNGMVMPATYSSLFPNPLSKAFVKAWDKKYGTKDQPDTYGVAGYKALKFIAQAIKMAGDTSDRSKIAAQMAKIKTFQAPDGTMTMINGDAEFNGKATMVVWNNKKLSLTSK